MHTPVSSITLVIMYMYIPYLLMKVLVWVVVALFGLAWYSEGVGVGEWVCSPPMPPCCLAVCPPPHCLPSWNDSSPYCPPCSRSALEQGWLSSLPVMTRSRSPLCDYVVLSPEVVGGPRWVQGQGVLQWY